MCSAELRRGLSKRAVYRAGSVLHVVCVRVRVRMRMRVGMVMRVRVCDVAVRQAGRAGVARAQVARAAMMLGQRQRGARRPPVYALLHVRCGRGCRRGRAGASRCAAARAAPRARQRMPPRLVRAPVLALAPRHPLSWPEHLPLASPPRCKPTAAHRIIRTNDSNSLFVLVTFYTL